MIDSANLPPQAASVIIQLLRGVLYNDKQPELWQSMVTFQTAIRAYLAVIGLQLFLDETEGYAFLRQQEEDDDDDSDTPPLPKLVQRRQLSYPVSLLCILLRKKMLEQDASGGATRVILSRSQIVDMVRVFLPQTTNEAKLVEHIDQHIKKVVDYGFLRRLKSDDELYEIRRIIKALVDANWLGSVDEKLTQYQDYANRTV